MKRLAISIGDVNGIGIEIALRAHNDISKLCEPVYCVNHAIVQDAARKLQLPIPDDFHLHEVSGTVAIQPGRVSADSGLYSFHSFVAAIELAEQQQVAGIVTLPIHKEAWSLAELSHKGHTDYLRKHFDRDAIMMLGCDALYVALFTEHIPLAKVAESLDTRQLTDFLLNLQRATGFENVAVLGLNPHAGDNGVLGSEETLIIQAIDKANKELGHEVFWGPVVPDTAFTPHALQHCNRIVAMYHDQGLAPLKALYFDQSVNISLNLPIIRTSVDHGTAFDIAYKNLSPNVQSYLNAVKSAISLD